jgi:hypothetical protein
MRLLGPPKNLAFGNLLWMLLVLPTVGFALKDSDTTPSPLESPENLWCVPDSTLFPRLRLPIAQPWARAGHVPWT